MLSARSPLSSPPLPRPGSDTKEMIRQMETLFWARSFGLDLLLNERLFEEEGRVGEVLAKL